jgi:uncharacterized membrane protein YidH (DUF202 family)
MVIKQSLKLIAAGVALAALQSPIFAQGCVMCKTTAASAGGAARLNIGVLVLLAPAAILFAVMFGVLYRYRDAFKMDDELVKPVEEVLPEIDEKIESALPTTV